MTTSRRLSKATPLIGFVLALALVACGDDGGSSGGDEDAAVADCTGAGIACVADTDCCTNYCEPDAKVCAQVSGTCLGPGSACVLGVECCSFSCVDATCSATQCVSDGDSCSADSECCGGTCGDGGTCTPLNDSCKTSGNACGDSNECCSEFCLDGFCSSQPSYCIQQSDVCTNDFECCTGMCTKADGASVGTCDIVPASGAGNCKSAGEVCGGVYTGGELPVCGGECCSRACQPYAPTGVMICQPPSGCRPTGEVCANDSDCCGSEGNPDGEISGVTCSKEGDNPLGRCDNGNSCTPAGGICRLQSKSCNENANCCSGNVLQNDTCKRDALGIPRCLTAEIDCTDPSAFEGMDCATSADCCGLPCTPSTGGEFPTLTCGGMCVAEDGVCTTSSDCCTGGCDVPAGSTMGTCGPPEECAGFGQACKVSADCCNMVTCNADGICGSIID